jgi:tRNA U34 2-thiouridine synthase MnmA/TrmU
MNKPRRKELQKALELLEQARDIIGAVMEEEQDAYDNLPDGIQDGEQGCNMSDNISDLEDVVDELDSQCENIEDIITR